MNKHSREDSTDQVVAAEDTPKRDRVDLSPALGSERRRHLLKAAVTAGPVIATLPSGEALAMASALQCIIKEQNGTNDVPDGAADTPSTDNYIRIPALRESRALNTAGDGYKGLPAGTPFSIYRFFDPSRNEVTVFAEDVTVGSVSTTKGTWFDQLDDDGNAISDLTSPPVLVELLRIYRADSNPITAPGDVAVDAFSTDPNGQGPSTGCNLNPDADWTDAPRTLDNTGADCVFPLALQEPKNLPGNIAITGSCLASFPLAKV
jgi:hypothetical protein